MVRVLCADISGNHRTDMLTRSPMARSRPTTAPKPPKTRKCAAKGCHNRFVPRSMGHKVCPNVDCAVQVVAADNEKKRRHAVKADRARDAVKRVSLKSLSDWIKDVQVVFNRFIRLRDQLAGHRCISSGRVLNWTGNETDAGHFRSRGSAPHLRFNEDNCHAQSKKDNRYGSGNAVEYRIGLIKRIGIERVEALESNNTPRKYAISELIALKAHYAGEIKAIKSKLPDSGFIPISMGDVAAKPDVEEDWPEEDYSEY